MEVKTERFDGVEYTTRTLTTSDGLVLLPKIIALFGEPVLKLIMLNPDDRSEYLSDKMIMATILHNVAKNAMNGELLVLRDLFKQTECAACRIGESEAPGNLAKEFDTHFQGRLAHLVEVAFWVATVNFIDP